MLGELALNSILLLKFVRMLPWEWKVIQGIQQQCANVCANMQSDHFNKFLPGAAQISSSKTSTDEGVWETEWCPKNKCKCRFYMHFSPSSVAVKKSKRRLKKVSIKVNSVKVLRTQTQVELRIYPEESCIIKNKPVWNSWSVQCVEELFTIRSWTVCVFINIPSGRSC